MADQADGPAQAVAVPPSDNQDDAAAQPQVSVAAEDVSDITNRLSELMTKPSAECVPAAACSVMHVICTRSCCTYGHEWYLENRLHYDLLLRTG